MRCLKDPNHVPPGGFRYTQPESGMTFRAMVYSDWVKQVRRHREANGYAVPAELGKELQATLCEQLPAEWCQECPKPAPLDKRDITFADARRFLKVLRAWDGGYVSQEEAERRAAICAGCPFNVKIEGCLGCSGIASTLTKVLGNKGTTRDAELKGCRICGCSLKAAVHFPLEAQQAGLTEEMKATFPKHCWKAPH